MRENTNHSNNFLNVTLELAGKTIGFGNMEIKYILITARNGQFLTP
jgi:hypothetical protein